MRKLNEVPEEEFLFDLMPIDGKPGAFSISRVEGGARRIYADQTYSIGAALPELVEVISLDTTINFKWIDAKAKSFFPDTLENFLRRTHQRRSVPKAKVDAEISRYRQMGVVGNF